LHTVGQKETETWGLRNRGGNKRSAEGGRRKWVERQIKAAQRINSAYADRLRGLGT